MVLSSLRVLGKSFFPVGMRYFSQQIEIKSAQVAGHILFKEADFFGPSCNEFVIPTKRVIISDLSIPVVRYSNGSVPDSSKVVLIDSEAVNFLLQSVKSPTARDQGVPTRFLPEEIRKIQDVFKRIADIGAVIKIRSPKAQNEQRVPFAEIVTAARVAKELNFANAKNVHERQCLGAGRELGLWGYQTVEEIFKSLMETASLIPKHPEDVRREARALFWKTIEDKMFVLQCRVEMQGFETGYKSIDLQLFLQGF